MPGFRDDNFIGFEALYKGYFRKAFSFAKSYVFDDLVAEDIASESLIKLWEQMKRDDIKSPEAFLMAILKNKALDYLKHEHIKEEVISELKSAYNEELDLRVSLLEACDPEEIFTAEIRQITHDTLAVLPEQTRRIFLMSRHENKTNKEISEELGFSVKNVEYHITKALKALRISLKDYLPLLLL